MAAHQFWRLCGFLTPSNSLELHQAQLYNGSTLIAQAPTFMVPPISGTVFPDVVRWDDITAPGFALEWSLSTPVDSPNLRLGAGASAQDFPFELYCQYSDDGEFWSTNNSPIGITFPGAGALTADPAQTTVGDPLFESLGYLLDFDGADQSTTLPNRAPSGITLSVQGSAKIATAVKRFGSAAGYFGSGPSWMPADGGGPAGVAPTIAATVFRTGEYCIEVAIYPLDSAPRVIAANRAQSAYGWTLYRTGTGAIEYQNVGSWGTIALNSASVPTNRWTAICVERYDNRLHLFINGKLASSAPDTTDMAAATDALILGWQHTGAGTASWFGYMDALRIGKSARRKGADYSLDTSQFPALLGAQGLVPYWAQTLLYASFDQIDDPAAFVDETGRNALIGYGNAAMDIAHVLPGGVSALKLNGGTSGMVRVDISDANSPMNLKAENFTLRMHFYGPSGASIGGYLFNFGGGLNYSWPDFAIDFYTNGSSGELRIALRSEGREDSPDIASFESIMSGMPLDRFYELQVNRDGAVFQVFVDKVLKWSKTDARAIRATRNQAGLGIGAGWSNNNAPAEAIRGWLARLRIIKGVAVPVTESFDLVATSFIPVSPVVNKRWRLSSALAELLAGAPLPPFNLSDYLREEVFMDAFHGGAGRVYGTVKEKHSPADVPLRRKVLLIDEASQVVIRKTWSDSVTGEYEFTGVRMGVKYTVLSYDHLNTYRAVVADAQTPEPML